MKIEDITWEVISHAVSMWNSKDIACKHQRFGQFFYNYFISDSDPWPELFYEKDMKKALQLIRDVVIMNSIELEE